MINLGTKFTLYKELKLRKIGHQSGFYQIYCSQLNVGNILEVRSTQASVRWNEKLQNYKKNVKSNAKGLTTVRNSRQVNLSIYPPPPLGIRGQLTIRFHFLKLREIELQLGFYQINW